MRSRRAVRPLAALCLLVGVACSTSDDDPPPAAVDVPDAPLPPEDAVAPPRVLAMWDSILLCYSDRSRTIPEEYRKRIIRTNGDVLPTVLVDGFVAGVWRPTADGIEVSSFRQLTAADWDGIEHEAATLRAFLSERDPRVYSGYDRWWSDLEMSERRLLAG